MAHSSRAVLFIYLFLLALGFSRPVSSPNKAHSVSILLARGTKNTKLDVCGKIPIDIKFNYPSSTHLLDVGGENVITFAPAMWTMDSDFGFKRTSPPVTKIARHYASEHILEYQLLFSKGGFLSKLQTIEDPFSTTKEKEYGKKLLPDPVMPTRRKIAFAEFMKKSWGDPKAKFTVGPIKNQDPFQILSLSFPNSDFFVMELVLLDGTTNGLKELIWSPSKNVMRTKKLMDARLKTDDTASEAFFPIKHTMFALRYMVDPKIIDYFNKQVDRIADTFDQIETQMEAKYKGYVKQNFGAAWKVWINNHSRKSLAKTISWLEMWGPKFVNNFKDKAAADMRLSSDQVLGQITKSLPVDEDNDTDVPKSDIPEWIKEAWPLNTALPPKTPANNNNPNRPPSSGGARPDSSGSDHNNVVTNKPLDDPFNSRGGGSGKANDYTVKKDDPTDAGLEKALEDMDIKSPSKEVAGAPPSHVMKRPAVRSTPAELAEALRAHLTDAFLADVKKKRMAAKYYGFAAGGGGAGGGGAGQGASGKPSGGDAGGNPPSNVPPKGQGLPSAGGRSSRAKNAR